MKTSFLIAMQTGCRLSDTQIDRLMWDFTRRTLTFLEPTGGRKRNFSIPLPSAIQPLLLQNDRENLKSKLRFPFQPSRKWQHFFHTVGLDHLCFHCLRVTFIIRLARNRVPLSHAMLLVNHAPTTIHRFYQRLGIEDVREIPSMFTGLNVGEGDQKTA